MIGRNVEGHMTFTADDREEVAYALKEILQTEIGQAYKRDYYVQERGDDDLVKILDVAEQICGSPNITVAGMERAITLLVDSGTLRPRDIPVNEELSESEPDTRPRDKNGKLLNESQLRYREYRQFSETASMAEINKRRQSDPGYASYVRKQIASEMSQPIDGAVVPAGDQRKLEGYNGDRYLVDFAHQYRVEPSKNLQPRGGYVTLAGRQIRWVDFQTLVDRASQAGLL